MKTFLNVPWDKVACQAQRDRFQQLLESRDSVSESKDMLPLFRSCVQLSACVGNLYFGRRIRDLVAFEYDLFGDFACDLVAGNSERKSYVFVEFEGTEPDNLFRRQGEEGNTGMVACLRAWFLSACRLVHETARPGRDGRLREPLRRPNHRVHGRPGHRSREASGSGRTTPSGVVALPRHCGRKADFVCHV
jgi:hypothetical protein